MKAMRKQYGDKEGEKVFYASKNKGTISGVENTEESKMSYLDKVLTINEKKSAPKRVNAGEGDSQGNPGSDEYVSGGRTGKATPQGRLLKSGTKKKTAMAADRVKDHTAGPKGKLPEHIEYKRIAYLMAEALGHRVDEVAPMLGMAAKAVGKEVLGGMAKKAAKKMQKKDKPVEEEEQRQEMASNDELKKRKAARDKMNKKIGDMFAGPSVRKPKQENSWTVYHDLGYTIAEALGLVSETRTRGGSHFIAARDTSTIKKKSKETGHSGRDLRAAGGSTVLADIAKADRERKAAREGGKEDK